MTVSPCVALKASLDEIERRLEMGTDLDTENKLVTAKSRLEILWTVNDCSPAWDAPEIEPPSQADIDRINQLMEAARNTTLRAVAAGTILSATVDIITAAGGTVA